MCGRILTQLSFNFREFCAIFTDFSFFAVITTGDTKQSSSTSHLFQCTSDAVHLCSGDQFQTPQYLHGRLLNFLFFGLVPNCSILCIGSSLIACFSFDNIRASRFVFFLFFFSYVLCFINSIIFFNSSVFFQYFVP